MAWKKTPCPYCGAKANGQYRSCCVEACKKRDAGRLGAERREHEPRRKSEDERLSDGFELLGLGEDEYISPYEP